MKGYVVNIEEKTENNSYFRQVLFTTDKSQLVVMALKPGEDIGAEVHEEHDQFIRIEEGVGKAIMDGVESDLTDGSAVVIPAGVEHNVINTGDTVMKLYTVYTPPEHADKTVHQTKAEAEADHHHE
jgi:mannose-6-phosphate isomerase-like protein (cupin superfamily)